MLNFLILLIFSSLVIPSGQKTVHDKKRTALFCDTQYIKISCRASFGWKEAEARTGNKCLLASKNFNIPFFKKKKKLVWQLMTARSPTLRQFLLPQHFQHLGDILAVRLSADPDMCFLETPQDFDQRHVISNLLYLVYVFWKYFWLQQKIFLQKHNCRLMKKAGQTSCVVLVAFPEA